MRKTRFFSAMTGCLLAAAMMFTSCSDEVGEEIASTTPDDIPVEVLDKFQQLGVCQSDIEKQGENYLIEGDIVVTPEALAEMKNIIVPGPSGEEQYRSCNLVNCNGGRTISIRGDLTGVLSTGLDYAIANWNALNTCFNFQRVYSGSADITVIEVFGTSGQAGFPSGGKPYPYIYIGSGLANYGVNVVEHVITHEIGHCLGIRHSDYFNRSYSCGSGGNEGSGGVCAIHIPGTPTSYDPNSIFNSCFSSSTNGEFSYYDRVAIEYLY